MYPCSVGEIGCLPALAGKEQDLPRMAFFIQQVERGAAARIVKADKRIVEYERDRIVGGQNGFADGETHGEVKLVERAEA